MKRAIKTLWNNPVTFGAAVNGTVAALATAGVIPDWSMLISVAWFAPRPGK